MADIAYYLFNSRFSTHIGVQKNEVHHWMDTCIVVHHYNEMLHHSKKEQAAKHITDESPELCRRTRMQKSPPCMTALCKRLEKTQ